jgi:UDP:flavonoid glycosyltransferase YjiC (YdhE family)
MQRPRIKLLFFAEAVTLAHVARPVALARCLDPDRYDIVMACDRRYAAFATGNWQSAELSSIPSQQFTDALARGAPVYDAKTLEDYAREDLRLIEEIGPDVVVGDFRISLSASARVAGVPYIAIANAYWNPGYRGHFPLPVLPMTKMLPLPVAARLFSVFRPLAFALHCRPLNTVRARFGLPPLGSDLRRVYTDADHQLVPDIESLYPIDPGGTDHTYVGPLTWSPAVDEPPWWDEAVSADTSVVYVTLGSSGSHRVLQRVLDALETLPVRVLASAAGSAASLRVPGNARMADYLPGDAAASRAQLVICNGGSLGTQQALAAGVPVLGIASNMDQFFNMGPLTREGAALTLRADRLSLDAIRQACLWLLDTPAAHDAARRLQPALRAQRSQGAIFDSVVEMLRARPPVAAAAGAIGGRAGA